MQARNSSDRWGLVARTFHWLIVALILAQFVLIRGELQLPNGLAKLETLARHKSVGITIFVLAALRLAWRALDPAPLMPGTLKLHERVLARVTHSLLYALLFAMPLSGWLMSSARNFPVSWFGWVQLPDIVAPDHALYISLHRTHAALAGLLVMTAGLHVLAALKHHFIDRNSILRRMLPFTRTPRDFS